MLRRGQFCRRLSRSLFTNFYTIFSSFVRLGLVGLGAVNSSLRGLCLVYFFLLESGDGLEKFRLGVFGVCFPLYKGQKITLALEETRVEENQFLRRPLSLVEVVHIELAYK